ncbi:MAG: 2-dehydropantoate 2-reductase [Alphaproteobacteria bacterium]
MHILILGAGAVGLGMAAALSAAKSDITLVTRGGMPSGERSIRVTGVLGDHEIPPGRVAFLPADGLAEQASPPDYVIVATKTFQVASAIRSIAPLLEKSRRPPAFLLPQNGWGSADEAAAIAPAGAMLYSAALMTGLARLSPAEVLIAAHATPIRIGSLFGHPQAAIEPLLQDFAQGFIDVEYREDIKTIILNKFMFSICLNAPGAILRCAYGEMAASPARRELMIRLADEAVAVVREVCGVALYEDGADYIHGTLIPKLMPRVAAHKSSMFQDLEAGRKTEIDYLNGAIARMAAGAHMPAPCNEVMTSLIHAAETGSSAGV